MEDEGQYKPLPVRRDEIFKIISNKGVVKVSDLSVQMGVTEMTIRRDLEGLEQAGLVQRTHGGAISITKHVNESLFIQKMQRHKEDKEAIAKVAVALVKEHDTVFLNSGTTTYEIMRNITAPNVKIVTNNAYIPTGGIPSCVEILSTGGQLRQESCTYIGDMAMRVIDQVFANIAFIGIDGFDIEYGLTTPVQPEANINRALMEHTRGSVYVVADSSKIGTVSNFFVAPITEIQGLITDSGITEQQKIALDKLGIEVLIG